VAPAPAPGGMTAAFLRLPQFVIFPDEAADPARTSDFIAREHWWTVCDETDTRCITLASFSPIVRGASMLRFESGGYITPSGRFGFKPKEVKDAEVYVFPYRYDEVVGGKSIRQRIFELWKAKNP